MKTLNFRYKNISIFLLAVVTLLSPLAPAFVNVASAAAPVGISPANEFTLPSMSGSVRELVQGSDGNVWFGAYSGSGEGKIGKITPAGEITEYTVGSYLPVNLVLGSDGAIWFANIIDYQVSKITPSGDITTYPLDYLPSRVILGPDGNIWTVGGQEVAGFGNDGTVTKITPAGVITNYRMLLAGSNIRDIAIGPDGNLWFAITQSAPAASGKIGKITPSGVTTTYDIPTAGFAPISVSLGPDGNVWFMALHSTDYMTYAVNKISPSGVITEYISSGSYPGLYLLAGPDGNMWFTTDDGVATKKIVKITPVGATTEYDVTDVSSTRNGMIAGPDGNLWFTSPSSNTLNKMTPDGAITAYEIPTPNSTPTDILFSPDGGRLWVAESSGGKIAYLSEVRPYIQSVSPTFSPKAGGGTITISGSFFQPGNTVSLQSNAGGVSIPLTSVVVIDDQTITAMVPPTSTPGLYNLTVANELGLSNPVPFIYGDSPILSVDFTRNSKNQLTMQINGLNLLSSGQLITEAIYNQPVITLNGVSIGFCTTSTYTASLLAASGIPAANYSDDPPCLELFDPDGGFGNASSLTDAQITVILPDAFNVNAPFEVSVWNIGTYRGNQSGGGTDPGDGNETPDPGGGSSPEGGVSAGSQLLIPGVPNTGAASMVVQKVSSVKPIFLAIAVVLCMLMFGAMKLAFRVSSRTTQSLSVKGDQ